jgi:tetrahydromethanopterin S-methyltransferase subunit E
VGSGDLLTEQHIALPLLAIHCKTLVCIVVMLSFATRSYLSYRREVDYKDFNEAIRVTLVSYHRSLMQGASTINLSLRTTLTLMINTLLPLCRE